MSQEALPHPLSLNIENEDCFVFIKNFSCLLGICPDIDRLNIKIAEIFKLYCKNLKIKYFSPKVYESSEFYTKKIKAKISSYFICGKKHKIDFKIINYEKDSKDKKQLDFVCCNTIIRACIKIMAVDIIPFMYRSFA